MAYFPENLVELFLRWEEVKRLIKGLDFLEKIVHG